MKANANTHRDSDRGPFADPVPELESGTVMDQRQAGPFLGVGQPGCRWQDGLWGWWRTVLQSEVLVQSASEAAE